MKYFAGLDVSLEETAVCIVDETGRIVREARVVSESEALVTLFQGIRDDDEAGRPGGVLAVGLAAAGAFGGGVPGDLH